MIRVVGTICGLSFCLLSLCAEGVFGQEGGTEAPVPVAIPVIAPRPAKALPEGLVDRILAARDEFKPVSADELKQSQTQLSKAVTALDKYLATQGANGRAWKKFLLDSDLHTQLKPGTKADLASLEKIYGRYTSSHDGLEMKPFNDVTVALRAYLRTSTAAANNNGHSEYESQLDTIAASVQALAQESSHGERLKLSQALAALDHSGRNPALVTLIKQNYSQPNLRFQAAEKFVAGGLSRDVDDTAPLHDNILGTRITGTGRTIGKVEALFVEDAERALIQSILRGTNYAKTVGYNGPAVIYGSGVTQLQGVRQFYINDEGVTGLKPTIDVHMKNTVTGVSSTKRGLMHRIVVKVAKKKVPEKAPQGERIGEQHARQMFYKRFSRESGDLIAQADEKYQEKFRKPLILTGQFPELLKLNTTDDLLRLTALQSGGDFLGADLIAPEVSGDPDMAVQVHESMVNNFAAGLLAGKTLTKEKMEELSLKFTGKLPESLEGEDEDEKAPWSVTFSAPEPVTLKIDDNMLVLTIRGDRYTSGGKAYDAMYITVRYKLQHDGQYVKGSRIGDLEILPPGFVQGKDKLAVRQQVLKKLLQKRFAKIFKPEFQSEGLTLPKNFEKMGPLSATQFVANDGWLVVGWTKLLSVERKQPKLAERASTSAGGQ